ncbi:Hypothetical predicted protein [Mytilus galloprovincialis]|uniref:Galectin n=1 Tax=Mytilus galloprovincialis TaxID=29158 RepID=A0A8B6BXH8_MYTGA|nr:Hypothetical predicted protein [Mytilus galloprovincialis]
MANTFVTLSSWNKRMMVGEEFALEVKCNKSSQANEKGGYSINFQQSKDQKDGIIFHFNPRAESSQVVLNTLANNKAWGTETNILDDNVGMIHYASSFKLKVKPITETKVHVYVNDKFKTEYECQGKKITDTEYLIFSPYVSIHPL